MCLLALFYRVAADAPVVAGANREEWYRRGGEPPSLIDDGRARFVAGLDPAGGGTWLGFNRHGVLAAVTNRRKSRPPARPRSRGLLVRDLLGCPSSAAALERAVRELSRDAYDGCNVVCADAGGAAVVQGGDWLRVRPLPPGLHVLTNGDMDDLSDPRLARAAGLLAEADCRTAAACVEALRRLCPRHEPGEPPICLHGDEGGTVSSTIIALPSRLADGTYLHAQGPPDRTPYDDYSALLRQLAD
jgi:uncharacterized protein with NRDE domain